MNISQLSNCITPHIIIKSRAILGRVVTNKKIGLFMYLVESKGIKPSEQSSSLQKNVHQAVVVHLPDVQKKKKLAEAKESVKEAAKSLNW